MLPPLPVVSAEREGHPLGGGALWWRALRLGIGPGYGRVGGFIPRGGGLLGPHSRFGFFSVAVYALIEFSAVAVLAAPGSDALVGRSVGSALSGFCSFPSVSGVEMSLSPSTPVRRRKIGFAEEFDISSLLCYVYLLSH